MWKAISIICVICFVLVSGQFLRAQINVDSAKTDIWKYSLEEVLSLKVVSAQKTEKAINKTPASVIIITRKEIENYGFQNLQEILNHIPGLYLWNGYHVRGRINIGVRGYTSSDNIIILVNGVNQVEGMYNEYLLTKVAVPVDAIDRIEVVRGPMSVLYGSGAFFGVINIITNHIDKRTKKSASVVYGSDQYMQGTFRVNAIENELKIGATASAFQTQGMDRAYNEMMTDPSQLTNWGLTEDATTNNILQDKNAYFNLNMKYKGLVADMTHTEVERGGFLVQPTVAYSPTKRHSTNFMMCYEHNLRSNLKLKGKFSYLTTNSLAFYFLNEKDSYISFGYNSDAYEAEVNAFYQPIEKLDITVGLFHRNVYYANNPAELSGAWGAPYGLHLTRLDIDSRMIENSIFTQFNYEVTPKLNIVGGIRLQQNLPYKYHASGGDSYPSGGRQTYYDKYEFDKLYFIPQISAIYDFSEKQVIKFLFGEALRNPPLGIITDILFSTADDETFDYPQLVPSKIRTYELNYSGMVGKQLVIHASLFRNELKNLISQYYIGLEDSSTVYYSSNKGEITTHGVELAIQYNPIGQLNLTASVAYQKSEDKTPGIEKVDVAYSPELLGYAKASYTFKGKYSIFATSRYVSEMLPEYSYQSQSRLGKATPAYTVVDAGVQVRDLLIKGLQIKLNITNLGNVKIYHPVTTLNQFADKGLLDFYRRFFIGVKYEF